MKLKYVVLLAIITVLIGICLMTFQSYALWVSKFKGGENIIEVGCFKTEFKELTSPIFLNNTYPMSDQKGLKQGGYHFSIKNTCSIEATYQITLNTLTTNTMPTENIKYAIYKSTDIKPNEGNSLSKAPINSDVVNLNVSNLKESFLIKSGNIKENESANYSLFIWIDESSDNEVMNQKFEASVKIITIPAKK